MSVAARGSVSSRWPAAKQLMGRGRSLGCRVTVGMSSSASGRWRKCKCSQFVGGSRPSMMPLCQVTSFPSLSVQYWTVVVAAGSTCGAVAEPSARQQRCMQSRGLPIGCQQHCCGAVPHLEQTATMCTRPAGSFHSGPRGRTCPPLPLPGHTKRTYCTTGLPCSGCSSLELQGCTRMAGKARAGVNAGGCKWFLHFW